MKISPAFRVLVTGAALGAMASITLPSVMRAQESHARHHSAGGLEIPESIKAEHAEVHEALVAATKAPGRVGAQARELAAILHPHFEREEQIALPPLALLGPLSRGEFNASMLKVLPLTDSLRAELPEMLDEHVKIHAATTRLRDIAREEKNAEVAGFASKLLQHAAGEEEVFYPAALLVGDMVRRLGGTR